MAQRASWDGHAHTAHTGHSAGTQQPERKAGAGGVGLIRAEVLEGRCGGRTRGQGVEGAAKTVMGHRLHNEQGKKGGSQQAHV